MRYTPVPVDQLSSAARELWSRWQQDDPRLDSPVFRPEFAATVATVRPGSEVAVFEDGGQPVGFVPYHRARTRLGQPLADSLTDFQGAIVPADVVWDPAELVRGCGLAALAFDSLLVSQPAWRPFVWYTVPAPYLDVTGGFAAYARRRCHAPSDVVRKILQRARKMEREVGPLRLEHFVTDRRLFQTLLAWKRQQYARQQARDVFALPWTIPLLELIFTLRTPGLSGILSVLYAGEQIAALHLGMMAAGVLHYWFPAYCPDLGRYSPGLVQLLRTVQDAPTLGLRRIDLGKGDEPFKASFMTGYTSVGEGAVDLRPLMRPWRRLWVGTQHWVQHSALRTPARWVVHRWRSWTRPTAAMSAVGRREGATRR